MLDYLSGAGNTAVILLPRTARQGEELRSVLSRRGYRNIVIPDKVYNGPNLIWHSDLVISGGGTMNREAAALRVPVYSIYQGPIGAVDRHLIATGRLVHVRSMEEVRRIPLVKAARAERAPATDIGARLTDYIVSRILGVAGRN